MKKILVLLLLASISYSSLESRLIKKFLLDNFEQNTGKNQYGGYWYVFNDRDEFFAKPDKITGKIWFSTAAVFTFISSTGGVITVNNSINAQVFVGCDWNGNGIYDVPTKIIPAPDPLEGTIFQAWPMNFPNSKYCARFEWDFTLSEMKYPFVGFGSNLINFETIEDLETDLKSYNDLSEFNAIAFWVRVSSTVGVFSVGVSYKNGPGAHGETPYSKEIIVDQNEREKWLWKVVRFDEMTLPPWVPTSKYSKFFNEFEFDLWPSLKKWDKIKSLNFEVEGERSWTSPKQNEFIGMNSAWGWMEIDDIYLVYIDTSSFTNLNIDTDGDGYSDFDEYAFGSSPTNNKSYPSRDINLNEVPDEEEGLNFLTVKCIPSVVDVNSGVKILYSFTKQSKGVMKIKILDSRGVIVWEDIIPDISSAQQYLWNCRTSSGKKVLPGVYIVYLELFNGKKKSTFFVVDSYK